MRVERDFRPVKAALFYESVAAIAGENADEVIRIFNTAIGAFFCLNKVARGALGLSLASGIIIDVNDFRFKKDREILKQVLQHDWVGSAKILGKLPAIMLSPDQYKKLRTLLGCDNAKKYLQHASIINGDTIDVLYALPANLRVQPILKHLRCQSEADLLSALCGSLANVNGLIQKAKDTDSRSKFWDEGCTHLVARAFSLQTGPAIIHPDIHQIKSPVDLLKLAKSYRNCLRNYIGEGISGESIFFEYRGDDDPAP